MVTYCKSFAQCQRLIFIILMAVAAMGVMGSRIALGEPPADSPFKADVERRLAHLQNIVADFDETIDDTPSPEMEAIALRSMKRLGNEPTVQIVRGQRNYRESFAYLNGLAIYDEEMTPETVKELQADHLVGLMSQKAIYENKRVDTLIQQIVIPAEFSGSFIGSIESAKELPDLSVIEFALGMRRWGDTVWPNLADLSACDFSSDAASHLVTAKWKGNDAEIHTWVYDPSKHFALVSYTLEFPAGKIAEKITCNDFVAEGELELPATVIDENIAWLPDDKHVLQSHVARTSTLSHIRYKIGDPANKPENYQMVWPKGSEVGDERINKTFGIRSGDRLLTDAQISELATHAPVCIPPTQQSATTTRPAMGTSTTGP